MKKVLIITYYWPPAGGPGVQRWLKFVKYLRDFSVEPIVYVPENPHYPLVDDDFEKEIPKGITIIKKPIKEPYALAAIFSKKKTKQISSGIITTKKQSALEKLLLWIRGNLFIPDARILWVKPSVKFLKTYLKTKAIDTIITTGPPHSMHLIGKGLKKEIPELRWLADFRDPWTSIGYHGKLKLTSVASEKHKKLEQQVLQTADAVIVTSPLTQKEFSTITQKPIHVITNGFDETPVDEKDLDKKFTVSHIGSLLSERNPQPLWEALSELINEDSNFSKDFRLQLAGTVSEEVLETIQYHGLDQNLRLLGYVSHEEALQLQRKSRLLLLVEINSEATKAILPGKIFEYLAARRPIVAIGPEGSDIKGVLKQTQSGFFFSYDEKGILKTAIANAYTMFKKGNLAIDSDNIEGFHRKNLTSQLAKIINEI